MNERTDQAVLNGESDLVFIWKYVVITSWSGENLEPSLNFTMEMNFSLVIFPPCLSSVVHAFDVISGLDLQ